MNVVAEWSLLEGFINGLFVQLLGTNATRSAAIFSSIRNPAGQRDAFNAVASVTLSQSDQDLLSAYLKVCDKAADPRNKISHWVWGHSDQLPDAVLLAQPTMVAAFRAAINDYVVQSSSNPAAVMPEMDRTKIYAWYEKDFLNASAKIQRTIDLGGHLSRELRGGAVVHGLSPLKNEPEISKELDRILRDRQTPA